MAVEFIDEVAPETQRGVSWIEGADSPGVEFMDEASPAHPDEIAQRFLDPNYKPSLAESKVYHAALKARSIGQHVGDFANAAGNAAVGLYETGKRAAVGLYETARDPEKYDPLLTGAEGVARGTLRDMELAKKLLPSSWGADGIVNFDQFAEMKRVQLRDAALNGQPLTPQNFNQMQSAGDVPAATISQWRKEYDDDFVPQTQYENLLAKRATAVEEMARSASNVSVLTGQEAAIHPALSEGVSLVASPMALVPFGKAMSPANSLARGAVAQVLQKGGRAAEVVGETVSKAAALPERLAGRGVEWLSGSAEAGKAAQNVVKRGSLPTAALGAAGLSVPGLTETAAAIAGGKVAGRTIQGVGEAAAAAGRSVGEGPSRYGLFDRISKDAASPEWLKRAANAAKPLDGAASLAGSAVKGGAEGAAIGTVLGAVSDGEEGAAAGFGSGLALGSGAGLLGRVVGGRAYNEELQIRDLSNWLARKSPDEVANIANLKLSREASVNMMDTERLAKGSGQDVEFRYVTDKTFTELFGVGKGAQLLNGDKPVVFVNTGYTGSRSMFHETMHALDALDGFAPQRQALNRILFDQTLPDGRVVSKGLYSAPDLAEFTSQYRDRLNVKAKAEFDLLTPEDRSARIMSEVRSESFANLMNGAPSADSVLGSRNVKRRVADALLLAESDSMLGKMRRSLEAVGVKFDGSGDPSELFVKNGKPITNTPVVDAALRDYLRAKDNMTRRLVSGDGAEEPHLVVRPQDLLSQNNAGLIDTFKDHDIFAKNPDGSVKMMGGVPVLLSEREIRAIQTRRVDAMIDALTKLPSLGDPNSVTLKSNGAWEGRRFSEEQLAAFDALPDDVLSPAMKTKLRQLNELASLDGQQIIIDYNAALKGGKYSSGISPTTRAAVPLTFNISKAGNFYMTTLDTAHFSRKLGQWKATKPKAFDAWNGDIDAFMRDVFTYLDNHVAGRSGAVNLDADAAAAVHKKNVINDFFNVPKGVGNEDVNPVQLSTRGDKDNLIRARRFDRINRITPGAGDKFPIRYELQKANFMSPENASDQRGAQLLPPNPALIFDSAKRNHGVTQRIDEAGYILPNGELLDFSGRAQAMGYERTGKYAFGPKRGQPDYLRGNRQVDHREVEYKNRPSRSGANDAAMEQFLSLGAIRTGQGLLDIRQRPTASQWARIREVIEHNNGAVSLDVYDGKRNSGQWWDEGTKAAKIEGQIRRFYAGKEITSGAQFLPAKIEAGTELAPAGFEDGRATVSTRQPAGMLAKPRSAILNADLDALNEDVSYKGKIAAELRQYPHLTASDKQLRNPDKVIRSFIDMAKDNLRFLYDNYPPEWRARAKLWYDGANRIVTDLAGEYKLTNEQTAGVMAVLSPQMDWFKNVSLGKRVIALNQKLLQTNAQFTPELLDHAIQRARVGLEDAKKKSPEKAAALERQFDKIWGTNRKDYQNKNWKSMDRDGQAIFLRAVDETTNSPRFEAVTPEGDLGPMVRNLGGDESRISWGHYGTIRKALEILSDGSLANISRQLGGQHKVRNFFNNISNPNSPGKYVTIDTHANAAALLEPLSGTSPEVKASMSGSKSKASGLGGTYPVYAEAYIELAGELGILPRELQSITWEAVRGLFTAVAKRGGLKDLTKAAWKKYSKGETTANELRKQIIEHAGGINPPAWLDTPPRAAGDQVQLGGRNVPGRDSRVPAASRGGGGNTGRTAGGNPHQRGGNVVGVKSSTSGKGMAKARLASFLPASGPVSHVAIHKQLRAQAEFDLAQKSPGPDNLNHWIASSYLDHLDKKFNRGSDLARTLQLERIKSVAESTPVTDISEAFGALMSGGRAAAQQHLERLAQKQAILQ